MRFDYISLYFKYIFIKKYSLEIPGPCHEMDATLSEPISFFRNGFSLEIPGLCHEIDATLSVPIPLWHNSNPSKSDSNCTKISTSLSQNNHKIFKNHIHIMFFSNPGPKVCIRFKKYVQEEEEAEETEGPEKDLQGLNGQEDPCIQNSPSVTKKTQSVNTVVRYRMINLISILRILHIILFIFLQPCMKGFLVAHILSQIC